MAAYVVAVVVLEILWMPRIWGLVAAGLLFGPLPGAVLSLVADMAGAVLCYAIARGGGREWVLAKMRRNPRAARVVDLLGRRRAGVIVALTRVLPIMHYTFTSYVAGVAGVRFAPFAIGTFVGLLPFALLFPLVGSAALDPTSPTFVVGLLVVGAVIVVGSLLARRVLREPRPGAATPHTPAPAYDPPGAAVESDRAGGKNRGPRPE
jgi:uncharacterized membrane protein YdjX (TVP38/TMEM64 family)